MGVYTVSFSFTKEQVLRQAVTWTSLENITLRRQSQKTRLHLNDCPEYARPQRQQLLREHGLPSRAMKAFRNLSRGGGSMTLNILDAPELFTLK